MANTHPSDTAGTVPLYVEEVVQGDAGAVSQTRLTVQDASKLPRVYVLSGATQAQKLEALRALVAGSWPHVGQLELLAYIEDVMCAPSLLPGEMLGVEVRLQRYEMTEEERCGDYPVPEAKR